MEKQVHCIYEGDHDMSFSVVWELNEEKGIYEQRASSGVPSQRKRFIKATDKIGSKKYFWCKHWKKLKEKDQQLIFSIYGKAYLRDLFINDIENIKSVEKLHQHALRIYNSMGWNKPCTRCGGSGHYSYCQRYGTTCFKCDGTKLQGVTPTKREIEKMLKTYPEGIVHSEDYKNHEIKGKGEYKRKKEAAAS